MFITESKYISNTNKGGNKGINNDVPTKKQQT